MKGVSITDALARIQAPQVKARKEGLEDLKHILEHNRRTLGKKGLNDKNYSTLLAELFPIIATEKSNFIKSPKGKAKEDRLVSCADALRIIVEHGVKTFRRKHTSPALLEHVLLTLPLPTGQLCEPLTRPYAKVLRLFLEYKPHAEHLGEEEWRELISLCRGGIGSKRDTLDEVFEDDGDENGPVNTPAQGGTPSPVNVSIRSSRKTVEKATSAIGDTALENILCSLSILISIPHFPILEEADATQSVLHDFLIDLVPSNRMQSAELAFRCINSILATSITDNVAMAKSIAYRTIPQSRRLWHSKAHSGMKDQILLLLVQCESVLPTLLTERSDFQDELERLIDVLKAEYFKRKDIDLLNLDDMVLGNVEGLEDLIPMASSVFRLRTGTNRAEQAWALIQCVARINRLIKDKRQEAVRTTENTSTRISSKRRKIESQLESILRSHGAATGSERFAHLQVLAFMVAEGSFSPREQNQVHEIALLDSSSEDSNISSWALLVLACLSFSQKPSLTSTTLETYNQWWRLGMRAITSSATCRAGCQLLACLLRQEKVQHAEFQDTADKMLSSIDLSGPALLCDSAIYFWGLFLAMKARLAPASMYFTSGKVSQWIFARWQPSNVLYHLPKKSTLSYSTEDLVSLLASILGLVKSQSPQILNLAQGLLAEATAQQIENRMLLSYLTHCIIARPKKADTNQTDESYEPIFEFSDSRFHSLCKAFLEFLGDQINSVRSAEFLTPSTNLASKVGEGTMHSVIQLAIVSFSMLSDPRVRRLMKVHELSEDTIELRRQISSFILGRDDSMTLVGGLHSALAGLLTFGREDIANAGAHEMALEFGPKFWQKIDPGEETVAEDDLMIVEDSLDSQSSRARSEILDAGRSKGFSSSLSNPQDFRINQLNRTCLASFTSNNYRDKVQDLQIADGFFEFLVDLKAEDFLRCRPLFQNLFGAKASISYNASLILLEYVGQELVDPYEYERSESALGFALEIMTGLAEVWLVAEGDLQSAVSQIYEWFLKIALPRRYLSPAARICMADMLQRILELRPDYAKDLALESSRTNLFRILEESGATVKFHIGTKISAIFNFFILQEHESIFEDVLSSLPLEQGWLEGSTLRLYILAKLGAAWSTLLRRCIYAIAEAPRLLPSCSEHARKCFAQLARDMSVESPRELFRLFAPQITYTWLDNQQLSTMPFQVCGYLDLKNLLLDNKSEILAQILMRGLTEDAQELARYCDSSLANLIEECFGQCAAYCLAWDASRKPNSDRQSAGSVARLNKVMGKDKFIKLLRDNFPEVVSTLFKTADREESISKGFEKYDAFSAASHAYDEILSSGASQASLTVGQQPSFKASYLVDELDFLCAKCEVSSDTLWSSALYTFVFRQLLDSIHASLGSLHTCSVIRRLRILVSMAGESALREYPLEMALHSLRRFLVDTQCAEDVMGLFRYLISHGLSHLRQEPAFLTGFVVSSLVSLRAFLETPRESTTQESQYKTTMEKAVAFHSWLDAKVQDYQTPRLSAFEMETMRRIVHAAVQIRAAGNSRPDMPESELLSMILEDDQSGKQLVDLSSRDAILKVLCSEFDFTPNFREDILGIDSQAARCGSTLFDTIQQRSPDTTYVRWVSRVMGRAYAGTGDWHIYKDFRRPNRTLFYQTEVHVSNHARASRVVILRFLQEMLFQDDLSNAGEAERALQTIIAKTTNDEDISECVAQLPEKLLSALTWQWFPLPLRNTSAYELHDIPNLVHALRTSLAIPHQDWLKNLCVALARTCPKEPLLSGLLPVLASVENVAERLFPQILHLALIFSPAKQNVRAIVSSAAKKWLTEYTEELRPYVEHFFKAILYLRTQPIKQESTFSERNHWLDLDFGIAADVAARCYLYTTSLLFLETRFSESSESSARRSCASNVQIPVELLLRIYQSLDDKDSFYGIQQSSSLNAVMNQLEFENAGFESLSFRSAYYDSQIKLLGAADSFSERNMIKLLDTVNLNGISHALLKNATEQTSLEQDALFTTARKLERWDITAPADASSPSVTVFKVFQNIYDSADYGSIDMALKVAYSKTIRLMIDSIQSTQDMRANLSGLACLTEIEDVIYSQGREQFAEAFERLQHRNGWMSKQRREDIHSIDSCRQTLFSTVSKSKGIQSLMKISGKDARIMEVKANLASSVLNRRLGTLQSSLNAATYLSHLIDSCVELGARVDVAIGFEASNVLWDQGEMAASIRALQDVTREAQSSVQDISIGRPQLLATLGHRMSEARLEKAEEIIANYLVPAIEELKGTITGLEAGQVFHEFASFCDKQLQNPDSDEDFRRVEKLRATKAHECSELENIIKSAGSQQNGKETARNARDALKKAKKWLDLDEREYQRLKTERTSLLTQSLENYLLCLQASDENENDSLRFSALWLEYSEDKLVNEAVKKHIDGVPSRKFALLIRQWTSRQLDNDEVFQKLLSNLIFRICRDHPYHGMYNLFASSKSRGSKDEATLSRSAAASNVVNELKAHKRTSSLWIPVHNTNVSFVKFAQEPTKNSRGGSRIPLADLSTGKMLAQDARQYAVPPPTMTVKLREDCNYNSLPTISKYASYISIAGGISAPKVLTVTATDGVKYKQLFKSGNDDLRQDAVMEEVFEQVSNLLKHNRETRQRKLGIRSYKVLPLTPQAGVIEFVTNTIPLNDYLNPAHGAHYPKDYKHAHCRKQIQEAQGKPTETRVKVFHEVCEKFHPVLRFFFTERFLDPDEWFEKRLMYTRSTAAISMLGYILGLGDRHGQNILLDEKTGEVVHIDLGIAFESGRVLPVPEVVPFRLTRDIVDGMGITKTEGVFRRCCEFTLAALRKEEYSIMTILDVLRYDPLVSWSASPLKKKRQQQEQEEGDEDYGAGTSRGKKETGRLGSDKGDEGEADRALTVVKKKLSKSLSVTATVNELIQQATDEKNLALLFAGWAAYA